jgi:hypothetical protein
MDNSTTLDTVSFSQTVVEGVLRDIRAGDANYVEQFFAARPDWQGDNEQEVSDDDQ